jgi:hypothetical protein
MAGEVNYQRSKEWPRKEWPRDEREKSEALEKKW